MLAERVVQQSGHQVASTCIDHAHMSCPSITEHFTSSRPLTSPPLIPTRAFNDHGVQRPKFTIGPMPMERPDPTQQSKGSRGGHKHTSSAVQIQQKRLVQCTWSQRVPSPTADESLARVRLNTGVIQASSSEDSILPLPTVSPSSSRSSLMPYFLSPSSKTRRSSMAYQTILRCSDSQAFWLSWYFVLNLTLTLYNKFVLVSFPFPYTLTALHALCGSVGGQFLLRQGFYQPKHLRERDHFVLATFSVLYSINIAVSNVSLHLVTVPFHQVVRAATPIFTTFLSWYFFSASFSPYKLSSLVPVIAGVGLATYGDYYFTPAGFLLTLLGTLLAALKTIATHTLQSSPLTAPPPASRHPRILRLSKPLPRLSLAIPRLPTIRPPRLQLHPLDLLTRMSPLAFAQCIVYAHASGELDALFGLQAHGSTRPALLYALLLLANGVIAFALNVVSFQANRRAGALSMCVAGNVKQVLTILCAVSLFNLTITPANALGVSLTLLGGAWYAAAEYREKTARRLA